MMDSENDTERQKVWDIAGKLKEDDEFQSWINATTGEIKQRADRRRVFRHALLGLLFVTTALLWFWPESNHEETDIYVTRIGENRQISLPDGSSVMMNTNTRLRHHFTDNQRQITLLTGEAVFTVKKDPKRPFEVVTLEGTARALGTIFNVMNIGDSVEISVIEGDVLVNSFDKEKRIPATIHLSSGFATKIHSGTEPFGKVYRSNISRISAWQENRMEFHDVSLSEAIDEYNRYIEKRIVLIGNENIRMSGSFRIGQTSTFINALKAGYNLVAEEKGEDIILRSAPDG